MSDEESETLENHLDLLKVKKLKISKKISNLHNLSIQLVIDSDDYTEFKVRFQDLKKDYHCLNSCQEEIFECLCKLNLRNKIDEELKSVEELDKMYYDILAVHDKLFSNIEPKSNSTENVSQVQPQVKLPKIDLPTFNGNLKDWPHFKDMFQSLIHENKSLPEIEKFHYLVSCLKSEPLSLSKTLPLTNQNYQIIWNQLQERYDNKRLLAACYLEDILNAPHLTNESSKKLRLLIDVFSENSTALKAMTFPEDYGDFILCHIALQKLDKHTRQLFERKCSSDEFPTLNGLIKFLKDHCKSLEAASMLETIHVTNVQVNNVNKSKFNQNKFTSNKFTASQSHSSPRNAFLSTNVQKQVLLPKCLYCNKDHSIYRCQDFIDLSIPQRKEFIVNKQACFNCLSHGHTSRTCGSKLLCRKCSKPHHTMLHEPPQTRIDESTDSKMKVQPTAEQVNTAQLQEPSSTSPVTTHIGTSSSTTLLGTALIQIQDSMGNFHTARALCDPGSQVSFITSEMASKMSLPFKRCETPIQGISQSFVNTSNQTVSCFLKPRNKSHPCLQVNTIVLDCITAPLPCHTLPSNIKEFYKNIDLADPHFDVPSKIDILIGADLFAEVFVGGRKPSTFGYPTPFKTIFGWVLIGKTMINDSMPFATSHFCRSEIDSVDISLKKFWEIEEPPHKVHLSSHDKLAETLFTQTTERTDTGRYVVKLPFQNDPPLLGESKYAASRSFNHLERRLNQNPSLKDQYNQFMQEYLQLGHMRSVDVNETKPEYFIPHHEVFKLSQDRKTQQIRVVFNASAKTSNGRSLNDELLTGPKLQNDVCEIISKFRLSPIVFTADIAKMYRQILVHPEHQKYQAIMWRETPEEPVGCFLLNTVTYGVSSAPFQAIRTLQQLAKDEGERFPLAADALIKDIFVDDILTGASTLEKAKLLKSELISLLELGGFELKKWASNHPELLEDSEPGKEVTFNDSHAIKVLGMKWQPKTDCFSYEVDVKKHEINKRNILSLLSSIYDPLGWITPTILWAKKLMQTLWTLGVDWNEILKEDIANSWSQFVSELPLLGSIQIPRLVLPNNAINIQLHAFCDASSEGYGSCLYLRSVTSEGITVKLVMAKSKVAPLKSLTIPKLELCAAVLLCKLVEFYCKAVSEKLGELTIFAWTDSTVSLSWIRTSPHLLKTFVANRVATIQDVINPSRWCYVPTQENPADCPSRGLLPSQIVNNKLWWDGPKWLSEEPSNWPSQEKPLFLLNELPETKNTAVSFAVTEQVLEASTKFLKSFSSLIHLKRITAWCIRFIKNCKVKKEERVSGPLKTCEINGGLKVWIKQVQAEHFTKEMTIIKSNLPCKSELQRLDPFIDEEGVLRVGGRLRHSSLHFSARHPLILPKDSHLTTLLIDHYHKVYFHAGPRTLQSLIQRLYWILSSRNSIRKRLSRCVKCTRMKAKCPQPFMADLPDYRVNNYRPFLKIGIDFGGPFFIKSEKSRNPKILKAYLCLIICLATKALHLEVVSNLSTEAFLAAFERFIARRGLCTHVFSDRGTNFVGAKSALNELYAMLRNPENEDKIVSHLANKGIHWSLNPPSAPHFGGIWEAGIKSAKSHLLRVIGDQKLTFEELTTLFAQIEAVLNSRPLCLLSTDPGEINVLTPGHFLIGQPLLCLPQPDFTAINQNRLTRWQLLHQARQHFWNRWSSEYLHTLQQRSKWNSRHKPLIKINDVVLIKESNLPPQVWKLGRITTLLPGQDGITRVVKLQTNQGELIRPVVKLCPLPIHED